jgi:cold shock CspA family protein
MAIYFGKVNKYIADRGFGFVRDVFVNSNSSDLFFHIKSIKKSDFKLAQKIEADEIKPSIYFWYETEISKKGEQVISVLSSDKITKDYANILPGFTEKVIFLWKDVGANLPEWLVQITSDLVGVERVKQLRDERDKLELQIKKENEIKLKQEKERQELDNAKREALKKERLAQQELQRETERHQVEIENKEFQQLIAEMKPLAFTHSSQVSSYIMRNKLGLKYKHISGVVTMEKDGNTWDFKGGFPPNIYAQICSALDLANNGSYARVVGFNSFNKLDL